MPAAVAHPTPRFVRRTSLSESEYRVNFKQIDNDVINTLISPEAREITPLMSTIYLSLMAAPQHCWEREGVLRFVGEDRADSHLTAWEQMRELAGVANSTLSKALDWMHRSGVIGYDARANGVGIRVFFNRAAASIRAKPAQKNLRLVPTPIYVAPTPTGGACFKELITEKDLDTENPFRAFAREKVISRSGSLETTVTAPVDESHRQLRAIPAPRNIASPMAPLEIAPSVAAALSSQIAEALRPEIALTVKRESEKTKEWFINCAVPKATRVAQRETYDLLRAYGLIEKTKSNSQVGRYEMPAEQTREGKQYNDEVSGLLAQLSDAVGKAAELAATNGQMPLSEACRKAAGELVELRDQVTTLAMMPDELEARLANIEAVITDMAWKVTDEAARDAITASARDELRRYAVRMEKQAFEETVKRRVQASLRERYCLPALSTFYL